MDNHHENRSKIDGETVVVLLDQDEYPSHIGNVAAISDEHIWFLKRDMDELCHFRLEHLDASDCSAIEYKKETAYYRILVGVVLLIAAVVLAFNLLTGSEDISAESGPVVIVIIAFASIGGRFITSIHRHVIRFEMPDRTFIWRSPAIDFKSKTEPAHAVREHARSRGILRGH
jgi:hypothetical protein